MSPLRFAVALAALLAATASAPRPAPAQERDRASAEALFRAGREAMERHQYDEACRRFAESNRLDPAVGTVFNLGACEEKLGKLAEAWGHFREVGERLPASDDRVVIANARATAIEPRLAHLTFDVAGGLPSGARVVRDGTDLGAGSIGIALPANAGDHTIVLSVPGRLDRVVHVSIKEGESQRVALEPGPPAPTKLDSSGTTAPPGPATDRAPSTTASTVLIVAGAVGLVASIATGAVVLSSKGTVSDHCPDKRCDQKGLDAASRGRTFSAISTTCFAVGAVALGAGVTLRLTATPTASEHSARATELGVSLGGRF
jgi:hypothetical protein